MLVDNAIVITDMMIVKDQCCIDCNYCAIDSGERDSNSTVWLPLSQSWGEPGYLLRQMPLNSRVRYSNHRFFTSVVLVRGNDVHRPDVLMFIKPTKQKTDTESQLIPQEC